MILSVDQLEGGEILLEAIEDANGSVIVPRGTSIKKEYISLLQSLAIEFVSIEKSEDENIGYQTIIPQTTIDDMVSQVKKRMENHIYQRDDSLKKFEIIAREIVKEIDKIPPDYRFDLYERKSDLYEHSVMVALYSVALAKRLGIHVREHLCDIALGCLLHDIGLRYITVPFQNRNMSELKPEEQFEYKKHTILGYTAVECEPWISERTKKMILCHHENQCGSGFPMRSKNKELVCQIIQFTDYVDRSLCGIECKRANVRECFDSIGQKRGREFEDCVVEQFLCMTTKDFVV